MNSLKKGNIKGMKDILRGHYNYNWKKKGRVKRKLNFTEFLRSSEERVSFPERHRQFHVVEPCNKVCLTDGSCTWPRRITIMRSALLSEFLAVLFRQLSFVVLK